MVIGQVTTYPCFPGNYAFGKQIPMKYYSSLHALNELNNIVQKNCHNQRCQIDHT